MIIKNARLKYGTADIKTENGIITGIGSFSGSETVDACGKRVIPGLIDTHIHGFGGFDASDGRLGDISMALAKTGTTTWLPTAMTDSADQLEKLTHQDINVKGANIPGFHLEGPYISKHKKGAQNEAYIKDPDINEFSRFKNVAAVTLAPELGGAVEFIKAVGCHVSIGHTCCTYDEAAAAIQAGADCLTHTFNAMPPFLHREPGPIGAAFDNGAFAEVICDGVHVSLTAVRALYKMFGSDRLILVSDCIRPAGLADGEYSSGGLAVFMRNGRLELADGTLAGGSHPLLYCVKVAVESGIDFYEAVKMASETPAKRFGLNKGTISVGSDADMLILNQDMTVNKVFIGGKTV